MIERAREGKQARVLPKRVLPSPTCPLTSKDVFFMALYPQSNSPPPYFHKQLSGTSVALVCIFFFCFIGIVYLSAKAPRPTTRVLPSYTSSRLTAARRRRPRLLEISLDKHLDGTVHDWRVSHSSHPSTVESPTTTLTDVLSVHSHTNIQPPP
jgi:hypothetical protein